METKNSALHLIPVPLTGSTTSYLSTESIETAHKITHFIVENAKSARQFLKSINHPTPLQSIEIEIITDKPKENWQWVKSILEKGLDVGILSEAGLPAVADPGNEIVKIAHQNLCKVITHSGPNSMITALMASGMNGQQFIFHGYLPAKKEQLREKLIQIVKSHNYLILHIYSWKLHIETSKLWKSFSTMYQIVIYFQFLQIFIQKMK
ncbi:MAG: SAM-dependent methyltransferase [Saprospiraceae bacterium]|nr:SAM-dependent methyltransferase [Saprospiraceae bacterium]